MEWVAGISTDVQRVTREFRFGKEGYACDPDALGKSMVIQQPSPDGNRITHCAEDSVPRFIGNHARNEKDFVKWLKTDAATQASTSGGLSLLLCGRPKTPSVVGVSLEMDLRKLPLLKEHFEMFVTYFGLHEHLGHVIKRQRSYLSATCFQERIVYTGYFHSSVKGYSEHIGFTSTTGSSVSSGSNSYAVLSSCGMMLGCTKDDSTMLEEMLQDTPDAWNHPLLLPLIFIELQSRKLGELVGEVIDFATEISHMVRTISGSKYSKLPPDLIDKACENRVRSSIIQEDLARASRQMANIISHCECLLDPTSDSSQFLAAGGVDTNVTQRFFARFKELDLDYQDLIADCKINSDQAALFLDVSSNEQANGLAEASMTVAVVAMAYLPMSTLATLVAMPVIDLTVVWRDIHNKVVPHGTTAVSIWLLYYVAAVVIFTWATLELGWFWRNRKAKPIWKRSMTLTTCGTILALFGHILGLVAGFLGKSGREFTGWVAATYKVSRRGKKRDGESDRC